MNRITKYSFVFDRKKKTATEKTGLIELYIYTFDNKKSYKTTNINIEKRHWDQVNKRVSRTHPDHVYFNTVLENMLSDFRQRELQLLSADIPASVENIRKAAKISTETFYQFASKKLMQSNIKTTSARSQRRSLDLFKQFAGDISFSEITYPVIFDFNSFLHRRKLAVGTIWRFNKDIKKFLNLAINFGLYDEKLNPYKLIKIKRGAARETFLKPAELDLIKTLDYEPFSVFDRARDFFLLSCYTGLRYSDAIRVNLALLNSTEQGFTLSLDRMQKVDKRIYLKFYELFEGAPNTIVEKYLHICKDFDYNEKYLVGKYFSNPDINVYLKSIAEAAGIKKRLTYHVGRHTFGTLYAYQTKNIFEVMRAMGISTYNTARVYINLSEEI